MSIHTSLAVKGIDVSAVVIRADGRREDLGVIARRAWRDRAGVAGKLWATVVKAVVALNAHRTLLVYALWLSLALASLLTNAGRDILTNRIKGAGTEPLHLQWGTGSGGTASSTALVTANQTRVAGTSSRVTTSVTNDTYQVVGTITAGGTRAITEVGLFDGAGTGDPATGANMFVYIDHSVVNLAVNDQIAYTIKVQFA